MTDSAAPEAPPSARDIRRKTIVAIAHRLRRDDLGTGALASLRRNDPAIVVGQPAFHQVVASVPEDVLQGEGALRWATVVHAMAIGAAAGETVPTVSAGKAFADARLSEARFARLLASRGERFRDQIALIARYMHAKAVGFEWRDLGELVLVEEHDEMRAQRLRFRLARDYYRALASQDLQKQQA